MIFMKTTKDEKDKDKVLEQVLMDIEKQFGKGAVMRLGSEEHMEIDTTSSGSLALDIASKAMFNTYLTLGPNKTTSHLVISSDKFASGIAHI